MSTTALSELAAADSPLIDEELRLRFSALLRESPEAMHRDGGPVHLTASAIIVDALAEHVALVWHKKGSFWVQPGGHIEPGEMSFEGSARREAAEEVGLDDLERIGPGPARLHAHDLSAAFGACRAHWDVQYLLRSPLPAAEQLLRGSDETPEALWVPWSADGPIVLPEGAVPDLAPSLDELRPWVTAMLAA